MSPLNSGHLLIAASSGMGIEGRLPCRQMPCRNKHRKENQGNHQAIVVRHWSLGQQEYFCVHQRSPHSYDGEAATYASGLAGSNTCAHQGMSRVGLPVCLIPQFRLEILSHSAAR